MATVIIRHKVGNFDTWLKGHRRVNSFSPLVTSFKTFRDTMILIHSNGHGSN